MKKSKLFILLSALLVLVTALAACTPDNGGTTPTTVTGTTNTTTTTVPTTTATTTTPTTTTSPVSTTPVYGGSGAFVTTNPTRWDPGELIFSAVHVPYLESLTQADWTKGPQGTKEFPYNQQTIPDAFIVGLLAETAEVVDQYTIVYHLRKGITYWGNNPNMPGYGEEMVAADYIAANNRTQSMARSTYFRAKGEEDPNWTFAEAVAGDKYAVQVKHPTTILNWSTAVTTAVYPAKAANSDLSNWRNAIGTGPFVVTDFVPDSSISYTKNPNYWQEDPLHPGYKLPYLDSFRYLIITDPATQMAAVQTGKILIYGTTLDRGKFLIQNNPELKYTTRPENYNIVIFLRNDKAPFNNLQVRRALAIGINRVEILEDFMEDQGKLLAWPLWDSVGTDIYTPMADLPSDVQELYNYDVTKAKSLLAQAGYPNGFAVELLTPNVESYVDRANIVKSYWDQIGVTTTVNVLESGTFYDRLYGKNFQDTAIVAWGNSSQWSTLGWCWRTGIIYNYGGVSDPKIDQAYKDALNELDIPSRNTILKDIYVYGMQQSWEIALPQPITYVFWQPYMYGYAGEYASVGARVWIDQAAKAAAGH